MILSFDISLFLRDVTTGQQGPAPLPDAVEDFAVGEDADVDVGDDDVVKVSFPFIGEEEIRHPDFIRIRQCQVLQFTCNTSGAAFE